MYDELIKRLRECTAEQNGEKTLWHQATDAIEDLITALTASNEVIAKSKPKWIPVTERLPEANDEVLVYLFKSQPYIAWVDEEGRWETNNFYVDHDYLPTHWMPLPESPESEGE